MFLGIVFQNIHLVIAINHTIRSHCVKVRFTFYQKAFILPYAVRPFLFPALRLYPAFRFGYGSAERFQIGHFRYICRMCSCVRQPSRPLRLKFLLLFRILLLVYVFFRISRQ